MTDHTEALTQAEVVNRDFTHTEWRVAADWLVGDREVTSYTTPLHSARTIELAIHRMSKGHGWGDHHVEYTNIRVEARRLTDWQPIQWARPGTPIVRTPEDVDRG